MSLQALKEGDMVKLDLGCHVDGYIAVAATTVVVGSEVASGKAGQSAHIEKRSDLNHYPEMFPTQVICSLLSTLQPKEPFACSKLEPRYKYIHICALGM